MKIAHIINPVNVSPDNPNYLYYAQPVTFRSMLNAQQYAHEHNIEVELLTTQYPEDKHIIPKGFNITSDMDKSVHDYIDIPDKSKKLPRLIDIIDKLYNNSDAEILIYTNVDIGLQKEFYKFVYDKIIEGYDGFCINRRNIPIKKNDITLNEKNLETIYEQKGESHPGTDCFIFRREIVPKIKLNNMFIGALYFGTALRKEIEKNSKKFFWYKNEYLTFHLGNERHWLNKDSYVQIYKKYSEIEFKKKK